MVVVGRVDEIGQTRCRRKTRHNSVTAGNSTVDPVEQPGHEIAPKDVRRFNLQINAAHAHIDVSNIYYRLTYGNMKREFSDERLILVSLRLLDAESYSDISEAPHCWCS
jgi:hypothetical protein